MNFSAWAKFYLAKKTEVEEVDLEWVFPKSVLPPSSQDTP